MVRREPQPPPGPVFIGGTGRCGTHAVASLLAHSGRYALVSAELRLHISPEGLRGFAEGTRSRRHLLGGLRTHWWRHSPAWDAAQTRGAHCIAPRRRYVAAIARLAAEPPGANRLFISRRFVRTLLDPLAPAPGAWIEKSPDNCAAAGFLHRLFPEMRLIHVIRDGRDVACSFMRVPWAPDDFPSALAVWERGVLDAHRGARDLPSERVHTVVLEDLVAHHRERSYGTLVAFLDLPDEPGLRSFFETQLTPDRARIGRWRSDLHPEEHERADRLYRESLERLAAAGVTPLPPLQPREVSPAQAPVTELHPPIPIDPWAAATA